MSVINFGSGYALPHIYRKLSPAPDLRAAMPFLFNSFFSFVWCQNPWPVMVPFLFVASHSELTDLSKPSWLYLEAEIFPQSLTPGSCFPPILETKGKHLMDLLSPSGLSTNWAFPQSWSNSAKRSTSALLCKVIDQVEWEAGCTKSKSL